MRSSPDAPSGRRPGYIAPVLLTSLLLACGTERGVRPGADSVSYGGWVYLGPPSSEVVFGDGTVTFEPTGVEPVEATQLYEGYPGYWVAEALPPRTPFQLRLEGEGAYPTVWAGDTPSANGTWLSGALFAAEYAYIDDLLVTFAPPAPAAPVGALADGAIHVWGLPNDGTAWDCANVRVQGRTPVCYLFDEAGAATLVTDGPFDWFFAFDLAPGEIVLDAGSGPIESWTAREGDLVMAFWLEPA
jgi:hypothetical protein